MPRRYAITFKNVAVSAAQDLISVQCGSGKTLRICKIWLYGTDTTLQTAQMLQCLLKYATTFAFGSGGTVPSPAGVPLDPGDSAASFTSHINDTTASASTFKDVYPCGGHNYAGITKDFGMGGIILGPSEGASFQLLSTVSGTCHFSGGMEVEESGG
jgi:hypothetical protein